MALILWPVANHDREWPSGLPAWGQVLRRRFHDNVSGLMMGGYFIGFFGGSHFVPKILQDVGHIRTFGALSAIASAAVLVHIIAVDPALWTVMRLFTGFAYAGMYIVVESWLNDKSTNETRGQMLAVYMIITMDKHSSRCNCRERAECADMSNILQNLWHKMRATEKANKIASHPHA